MNKNTVLSAIYTIFITSFISHAYSAITPYQQVTDLQEALTKDERKIFQPPVLNQRKNDITLGQKIFCWARAAYNAQKLYEAAKKVDRWNTVDLSTFFSLDNNSSTFNQWILEMKLISGKEALANAQNASFVYQHILQKTTSTFRWDNFNDIAIIDIAAQTLGRGLNYSACADILQQFVNNLDKEMFISFQPEIARYLEKKHILSFQQTGTPKLILLLYSGTDDQTHRPFTHWIGIVMTPAGMVVTESYGKNESEPLSTRDQTKNPIILALYDLMVGKPSSPLPTSTTSSFSDGSDYDYYDYGDASNEVSETDSDSEQEEVENKPTKEYFDQALTLYKTTDTLIAQKKITGAFWEYVEKTYGTSPSQEEIVSAIKDLGEKISVWYKASEYRLFRNFVHVTMGWAPLFKVTYNIDPINIHVIELHRKLKESNERKITQLASLDQDAMAEPFKLKCGFFVLYNLKNITTFISQSLSHLEPLTLFAGKEAAPLGEGVTAEKKEEHFINWMGIQENLLISSSDSQVSGYKPILVENEGKYSLASKLHPTDHTGEDAELSSDQIAYLLEHSDILPDYYKDNVAILNTELQDIGYRPFYAANSAFEGALYLSPRDDVFRKIRRFRRTGEPLFFIIAQRGHWRLVVMTSQGMIIANSYGNKDNRNDLHLSKLYDYLLTGNIMGESKHLPETMSLEFLQDKLLSLKKSVKNLFIHLQSVKQQLSKLRTSLTLILQKQQ